MSKWKKKSNASTIWDVIHENTGLTKDQYFANKEYKIKGLSEVANVLTDAAKNKTPVTIVGDYDAGAKRS